MTVLAPAADVLVVRELTYRVGGQTLVDSVSFALPAGEVLAIVGPNGAGKSTLLRRLAGELAPSVGEIRLGGATLRTLGAREQARRRALMAQQTRVPVDFSGLEVCLMGRYPHLGDRHERPIDLEIAFDALARAAAGEFADRSYPTLSGGEAARVQLARVIAQTTPVLLLDEPTASLDLRHQHAAMAVARQIAREGGAVAVVLHDLNLAAGYADRIALLAEGRVVAIGDPWRVLDPVLLEAVYGTPVIVERHPATGGPLVIVPPAGSAA